MCVCMIILLNECSQNCISQQPNELTCSIWCVCSKGTLACVFLKRSPLFIYTLDHTWYTMMDDEMMAEGQQQQFPEPKKYIQNII